MKPFDINDFKTYEETKTLKFVNSFEYDIIVANYILLANTTGGVMLVGIDKDDSGEFILLGLDISRRTMIKKSLWKRFNDKDYVNINTLEQKDIQEYIYEDSLVVAIFVPKVSPAIGPVYTPLIRYTEIFWEIMRKNPLLYSNGIPCIDYSLVYGTSINDLNVNTVERFRKRHALLKGGNNILKLDIVNYLYKIGAIRRDERDENWCLTIAGLLMFGKKEAISACFPYFDLEYHEINEKGEYKLVLFSHDAYHFLNVFDFYLQVYNRLISEVNYSSLHNILNELLLNCLMNANYFETNCVTIKNNKTSLSFQNTGKLMVSKGQYYKGGISNPRNRTIFNMFRMLGAVNGKGVGASNVLNFCNKYDYKKMSVTESRKLNKTTIEFEFNPEHIDEIATKHSPKPILLSPNPRRTKKTQQQIRQIEKHLKKHDLLTVSSLARLLGLSVSRVRTILNQMDNVMPLGKCGKEITYSLISDRDRFVIRSLTGR